MTELLTRAGSFAAIILLGFLLRKFGFFKSEDFQILAKITIRITLPCAIITSFAGKSIDVSMLILTLLGLSCGILYISVGYLIHLKKPKSQQAFGIMNMPGYNIGTFTMPFVQSFLGPTGVIVTSLFDAGNAFICLGGSYGIASMVQDGCGFSPKRLFKALFSSVPFVCYITVVILNLAKITIPSPIVSFAGIVGNANAFCAMLMIGVGFRLSGDKSQIGTIVKFLTLRFGIAAILALIFYNLLPFSLEIRQALVILVFSPIGSATPGFVSQLKGDVGLSSALNSISILCSIVFIVTLLSVMLY